MSTGPGNPHASGVGGDWADVENVHRFAHFAMNSSFEIVVQHEDAVYTRQASQAAFDVLDKVEGDLSRYIETSDVARINNLPAATPLQVSLDTFECLKLCEQSYRETQGAFDATTGLLVDCWRDEHKRPRTPSDEELQYARTHTGMPLLQLNEEHYMVALVVSPIRLDLGGIGKGYGVDRIGRSLREWGLDRALIHGGFSTVLALDAPVGLAGWPITLSDPEDRSRVLARMSLERMAVAGSGIEKGLHIIDPRRGKPVQGKIAAWSVANDAVTADALSTAFMVISVEEVREYCRLHEKSRALLVLSETTDGQRIVFVGTWPEGEL
jgi:thiamine biosynthesis lipoprotein